MGSTYLKPLPALWNYSGQSESGLLNLFEATYSIFENCLSPDSETSDKPPAIVTLERLWPQSGSQTKFNLYFNQFPDTSHFQKQQILFLLSYIKNYKSLSICSLFFGKKRFFWLLEKIDSKKICRNRTQELIKRMRDNNRVIKNKTTATVMRIQIKPLQYKWKLTLSLTIANQW